MESIENKIKLCKHLHLYNSVPSGNKKFYTHLWSSCTLEHLGKIQEICCISGQVQIPQVWVFWTVHMVKDN